MATYMHIDGIPGDVTARGHEQWIQIQDINFNVQRSLSTEPGRISDREGTRPAISELNIIKKTDKSSPLLFGESCVGRAKSEVVIELCKTDNYLSPYLQITLNNVIVSRFELQLLNNAQGSQAYQDSYPFEKLSLSYDKIEVKYTPYGADNKPESPIPAGYDLREAVAI